MAFVAPFGTTVKRYNDDVAATHQVIDNAAYTLQIQVLDSVGVMSKGAQAYLLALAFDDGTLHTPFDACIEDVLFFETAFGGLNTFESEVVSMVVGHTQKVEACVLQVMGIGGGSAEGIAVLACAFCAFAAVA